MNRGEIENGAFGSHGFGWEEYPSIEAELKPMHDIDDGVFYMTKREFFEFFETVYLGASDMTQFLKDGMKMSKHSSNSKHARNMNLSKQSTHSASNDSLDSFILEEDEDDGDKYSR